VEEYSITEVRMVERNTYPGANQSCKWLNLFNNLLRRLTKKKGLYYVTLLKFIDIVDSCLQSCMSSDTCSRPLLNNDEQLQKIREARNNTRIPESLEILAIKAVAKNCTRFIDIPDSLLKYLRKFTKNPSILLKRMYVLKICVFSQSNGEAVFVLDLCLYQQQTRKIARPLVTPDQSTRSAREPKCH
jgi:hypothetical protein